MLNEKNINGLLAVFFILLVLGFLVHRNRIFPGTFIGHGLGVSGTICIFLALLYPFRKRVLGKRGKQNPLNRHITYGLTGSCLVVIHSAHKVSSLIGLFIFLTLILLVLSGIVGRFLRRKVGKNLKDQKKNLGLLKKRMKEKQNEIASCDFSFIRSGTTAMEEGNPEEEISRSEMVRICRQWLDTFYAVADLEYSIKVFDRTQRLFSGWIRAHYGLTFLLLALLVVHVMTVFYYGIRWLE